MPTFLKTLKGINIWKLLAIVFAFLNLKYLPFAWHLRILNGLLTHLPLTSHRLHTRKIQLTPSALFQPMILSSRAQPFEIDYNLHKSNSTYFSDFDIARLHLLIRLCSPGLAAISRELWLADNKTGPKQVRIMMGGVSCNFRREIRPFGAFEMWTRVLCWDRKWFFVVTFFVEKGVRPRGWTLQPRRRGGNSKEEMVEGTGMEVQDGGMKNGMGDKRKGSHPAIFATGIAKYVCKRGRMTVSPEKVLQASGLLPPKPRDTETPPTTTDSPAGVMEGDALPMGAASAAKVRDITSSAAEDLIDAALNVKPAEDGEWGWERVERERRRGMKIAEAWSRTEELGEGFLGDEEMAFGRYWDWF
ncbi:MAG: hypothetical protein Q9188_000369 [Gyalolechia gomerana]